MATFIKGNVYLLVVLLVLQLLPSQTFAAETEELPEAMYSGVTLFSADADEVELFTDETKETVLTTLPNGTVVELIEEKELVSLIRYIHKTPDEEPLEWIGYVSASTIERPGPVEEVNDVPVSEETKELEAETALPEGELQAEADPSENAEAVEAEIAEEETIETKEVPEAAEIVEATEIIEAPEAEEQETAETEAASVEETKAPEEANSPEPAEEQKTVSAATEVETEKATVSRAAVAPATLQGIALDKATNVYKETSTNATVLKTYAQGRILKFQSYNGEWFSATVYLNGKAQKGFLHKSDVDLLKAEQKINGFAVVESVKVFQDPTAAAKVIKTYEFGQAMIYRTFSTQWHKVTVMLNGEAQTGYINATNVNTEKQEAPPASKESVSSIKGIAALSTVSVYSSTSKNSSKLKSYGMGHVLAFKPFSDAWYQATVYVRGRAHTGYIYKNDVERITTNPQTVKGIGVKSPTKIYSKASTGAAAIKSYALGSNLTYRTFTASWYEATVYVKGKAQIGYLHKGDVEKITTAPEKVKRVAIKSPTKVYARASTGAAVLKSYAYGSNLTVKTYTSLWYEANFYVNGTRKTGYISKADVVELNGITVYLDPGHGGKDGGASANGIVEKDLVLDIGLRTENLLKNAGFTVLMTRKTDVFLELAERAQLANASKADVFISIHANAFNGYAKGIETFWYDKYEAAESKRLANELQENLVDQMGLSDRRVAEGNFHVIRETKPPSALVEVGFIDNAIDAAKLKLAEYKQRAAEGIFAGILQFFS